MTVARVVGEVASAIVLAADHLQSAGDLIITGYGRIVLGEAVLLAGAAGLWFVNHRYNLPLAERTLTSVRRTSWSQLLLAGAAAVTAGLLAVVTPPVGSAWAGHLAGGQALSGSDPGETATAEVGIAPGRVPRWVRPGSLLRPRAFSGRGERRDPGRPDLDDPT